MRTTDCEILVVPGLGSSGPDHWQSRWERQLSSARRIEQDDWNAPRAQDWCARIVAEVARARKPAILVAHSLGVAAVAHAAPSLTARVAGAFLVAPADVDDEGRTGMIDRSFAPLPRAPLPFPSVLVASRNDPYCAFEAAEALAAAWGGALVDAGESGHLNVDSGHGPWPEGLMRFAGFLRALGAPR